MQMLTTEDTEVTEKLMKLLYAIESSPLLDG